MLWSWKINVLARFLPSGFELWIYSAFLNKVPLSNVSKENLLMKLCVKHLTKDFREWSVCPAGILLDITLITLEKKNFTPPRPNPLNQGSKLFFQRQGNDSQKFIFEGPDASVHSRKRSFFVQRTDSSTCSGPCFSQTLCQTPKCANWVSDGNLRQDSPAVAQCIHFLSAPPTKLGQRNQTMITKQTGLPFPLIRLVSQWFMWHSSGWLEFGVRKIEKWKFVEALLSVSWTNCDSDLHGVMECLKKVLKSCRQHLRHPQSCMTSTLLRRVTQVLRWHRFFMFNHFFDWTSHWTSCFVLSTLFLPQPRIKTQRIALVPWATTSSSHVESAWSIAPRHWSTQAG